MAGTPAAEADHWMFSGNRLRGWAVRIAAVTTWVLLPAASVLAFDEVPLGKLLRTVDFSTDVSFDSGRRVSARDDCIVKLSSVIFGADDFCFPSLAAADIDAAHVQGQNIALLVSFDSTLRLANGQVVHPADIAGLRLSGGSGQTVIEDPLELVFLHESLGLADSADIDAIAEDAADPGRLRMVLSFAATTVINGELTAQDEDLVRYAGQGGYPVELFFDGSAHGVAEALDVDAAEVLADGRLVLSFDTAGTVPGSDGPLAFADEDLLLFDFSGGRWEMFWDASTTGLDFGAVDIDAVSYIDLVDPTPTPTAATATATPNTPSCPGDCNSDRRVVIGELIRGVNISLGKLALVQCRQFDTDGNTRVSVGELIAAVRAALNTCP